ncbi:hypothetical protein KR059_002904, partial [Drosophila kikkawai]
FLTYKKIKISTIADFHSESSALECLDIESLNGLETEQLSWLGRIRYTRFSGGVWYPCSGVAITPHHVLAPAHCVMFQEKRDIFSFLVDKKRHAVSQVFIHPEYRLESSTHDVAVLKLNSSLSSCLALSEVEGFESLIAQRLDVVSSAEKHPKNVHAQAKVTGQSYCQRKFKDFRISENEVCAHLLHRNNEFLNGAALLGVKWLNGTESWRLLGISTHGPYERNNQVPDLYTLVAPYAKWIKNIT